MMKDCIFIAMWSGPRNISTALMRAWENRADTAVIDEPFYAHYLHQTGSIHPGQEAIMASQPTNWQDVAKAITQPPATGEKIYYQKHMSHHLLNNIDHGWMDGMRHAFLIREPAAMIKSYVAARERLDHADDLGLATQVRLFNEIKEKTGETPAVIDSVDVLKNPKGMLQTLCKKLNVPFDEAMLSWPAGKRASDGVWAPYWYGSVEQSTGFAPYKEKEVTIDPEYADILAECMPHYETLYDVRLTA